MQMIFEINGQHFKSFNLNFWDESSTFHDELTGWKLPFKNLKKLSQKNFLRSFQPSNFQSVISTPIGGRGSLILVIILKIGKSEVAYRFLSSWGRWVRISTQFFHPTPNPPLNMVNIEKNWKRHVACLLLLIQRRWVRISGYCFDPTPPSSRFPLSMANIKKNWKPDVACQFLLIRERLSQISAHFFHLTSLPQYSNSASSN